LLCPPITLPLELIKIAAKELCQIQILEDEIIFIYPDSEERKIKINSNGRIQFKDGEVIHHAIIKGNVEVNDKLKNENQ
jgi:hypothetical protein